MRRLARDVLGGSLGDRHAPLHHPNIDYMLLPTVNPGETPGGAPAQPASAPNAAMPVSTPAPVAARSIHPFASRGGSLHAAVNPGQGQGAPEVILDWMAHIRFNKFELQQSFGVLIFIGDVPANAEQWRSCPAFVGYHAAYVASLPELYTNCPVLMTVGSIYLNSAIAEQSGLSSFEPNVVVPYLKANLHWRVQAVWLFCIQSIV